MSKLAALSRRNRPGARVVPAALVDRDFTEQTIAMEFGDLRATVSRPGAEKSVAGLILGWRDQRTEQVAARTLSSIIEELGDPPIDLLSLDVEGQEAAALGGLDLDRHAPSWILVEMHDLQAGRAAIAPVLGDRYVEHSELSPVDVLYRRVDVSDRSARPRRSSPASLGRCAPGQLGGARPAGAGQRSRNWSREQLRGRARSRRAVGSK